MMESLLQMNFMASSLMFISFWIASVTHLKKEDVDIKEHWSFNMIIGSAFGLLITTALTATGYLCILLAGGSV